MWTYGLIAVATANTEDAAKKAAAREAEQKAQQALDNKRQAKKGRCPRDCAGGRLAGRKKPVLKHIYSYEDTDRRLWVAYYSARWHCQLKCKGNSNALSHSFSVDHKNLPEGGEAPQCGKQRFYSGCTLGFGSGTNAKRAKKSAVDEAKAAAQTAMDNAKAKRCPARQCPKGAITAPPEPITTELAAYRIFQIAPTTFVAYATAHWLVTISCPAAD